MKYLRRLSIKDYKCQAYKRVYFFYNSNEMTRQYYTTIGLEIHAELKTQTKMFCDSRNDPEERIPNMNVCPVCMAHPGTLPVINKAAVEHVIRVGLALGGTIADFTEFDRKNYFYPDIPKGYQISQYKYPIVSGGSLADVAITRVHLEEDTATSKHDRGDYSLVDFNRAGVPLMELVTEPVIHDTERIVTFGKELQLVLRTLGASEANMEKGQMRVEVNVSVSPDADKPSRAYVELKNINSFQSAKRAAEFEIKRQIELWEAGKESEIVKETRGWDEAKQRTFSQRRKEDSHDYRYFPDPDLPKLKLSEAFDMPALKAGLPELPKDKRARYASTYGIKAEDIESYVQDEKLGGYFESVISGFSTDTNKVRIASNYITSDLVGLMKSNPSVVMPSTEAFAELVDMITDGVISSRGAKDILAIMASEGGKPMRIAETEGLLQKSDEGELKMIIQKSIDANPKVVDEYKAGKEAALMFFVGQVMKESKGSANPALVQKITKELLA